MNNLLGAASINIMLLAVADVIYGRGALTSIAAKPAILMQGILSILLMTSVAMIATIGDVAVWGFGAGSAALLVGYLAALRISSRFEHKHVWEAVDLGRAAEKSEGGEKESDKRPLSRLIIGTVVTAVVILIAGFFLSSSANALSQKTGVDAGLAGFLVGFATSLPELSSVTAAIRLRRYQMAVGDIFGTNLFNIALLFLADVIYRGEPVLSLVGDFEVIGALLAVLLTSIFMIGLLERKNQTVFRMGYDAFAAILLFAAGLYVLSQVSG